MSNAIISYPDQCLAATLSGGSWGSTLDRLKDSELNNRATTTSDAMASSTFLATLDDFYTIRTIGLLMHNLSKDTRIRMHGYSHAEAGVTIITNGDFATDTWWSKYAGCTISGGKGLINITASTTGFYKDGLLIEGRTYDVTFTILSITGTGINCSLSKYGTALASNGIIRTVAGTYTERLVAPGSRFGIYVISGTTVAEIDNVSVSEVPNFDTGAVTNEGLYSIPKTANWDEGTNATITDNTYTAPDGTTTAAKMGNLGNGGSCYITQRSSGQAYIGGVQYVASVYVKKTSSGTNPGTLRLALHGNAFGITYDVRIDLNTLVVTSGNNPIAYGMIDIGDGWYRIWVSHAPPANASSYAPLLYWLTNPTNTALELQVWGMQLEKGPYPTDYIPTTSAAVTVLSTRAWPEGFTDKLVARYSKNWIGCVSPETTSKYIKVEIDDTTNPDTVIKIGRCWIGEATFEPAIGVSYGAGLGYESRDEVSETYGGTIHGERKEPRRKLIATFEVLTAVEKRQALLMQKDLTETGEALWVTDSNAVLDDMVFEAFPCFFRKPSTLTYPYHNNNEMAVEVIERL